MQSILFKRIAMIAVAAFASNAGAATSSNVRAAFGNTVVSTYPDGRQADLWLAPDSSYTAEGRRGDASGGRWSVKDGKLCLKQSSPIPAPFSYCTPLPRSMSGAWTAKAVTGEEISVRLVHGHVRRHAKANP